VVQALVCETRTRTRRKLMTQSQVAAHLAEKVGISKKDAKVALEELTTLVVRELKKEGSLRLAGLGFSASARPRRGWGVIRRRASKSRFQRAPASASRLPRR
jgi:nucleoid DNA-binding protein